MTSEIRRGWFRFSASSQSIAARSLCKHVLCLLPGRKLFRQKPSAKAHTTSSASPPRSPHMPLAQAAAPNESGWARRDPVLLSASLGALLLIIYQIVIMSLKPSWLVAGTDWLRAMLAWPELLPSVLVSLRLSATRQPGRFPWWIFSLALFSYALAQNLWLVFDQYLDPGRAPVPSLADLFYLLQYPFLCLALLVLMPGLAHQRRPKSMGMKVVLDSLLLTAAGTALSWYFILAPIYSMSTQSGWGKATNLAYPVGDLLLLVGLALVFTRHRVTGFISYIMVGVLLLMIADSWFAYLNLSGQFQSGLPPDLFWLASYLVLALAGLVKLRQMQRATAHERSISPEKQPNAPPFARGWKGTLRIFTPFLAAFLASIAIVGKALLEPRENWLHMSVSFGVGLGLLLLVMARQGLTMLENERLSREREEERAHNLALREAARQMDAFLGIASHELKTPLTAIILGLETIRRRLQRLASSGGSTSCKESDYVESCQMLLEETSRQGRRLDRLVNDLLDTSRIQAGQLRLKQQPTDLFCLIRCVVEEQRRVTPTRTIVLYLPEQPTMPVFADPDRIRQVLTNFLTNALKYSPPEASVAVALRAEDGWGRVEVHDQGPGLSPEAQKRLWERFYRVPGVEVQAGSQVGLGLGLHICKTIVEQHQGQVGVQSTPGQGATFWFALPLNNKAVQAQQTLSLIATAQSPPADVPGWGDARRHPPQQGWSW